MLNYILILGITAIGYNGKIKEKMVISFSLIVIWAIGEVITGYITMVMQIYFVSPELQGSIVSNLIVLFLVEIVKKLYYDFHKGELNKYAKYILIIWNK